MANKKNKKTKSKSRVSKRKSSARLVSTKVTVAAVCAVLVIAIIVSAVVIFKGANRTAKSNPYHFSEAVSQGIDVSEHNGDIDWQRVKENVDFAFIRLGYRGYEAGNISYDQNYKSNIEGCEKAGIPYGVYFYSQAVNEDEAVEEADFLIKALKRYDPSLPLVIDFEYAADKNGNHAGRLYESKLSNAEATNIIKAFCDEVESYGYLSGVYASSSVMAHKFNPDKLNESTLLWVADYNGKVTYNVDYTVWQYTKTGKLDGVESEYVDFNYWYE